MKVNKPNHKCVFQSIFYTLAIVHFLFFEIASRQLFGTSFLEVIYRWLAEGQLRVGILIFWIFSTLGWIALAGDHLRNVYVAATGEIEPYVFLGDKLREGQYLYLDQHPSKQVIFSPWFILKNQYPCTEFSQVYKRVYMLRDKEGKLTPTTDLRISQVILMTLFQLALLPFSILSIIFILTQFSKITGSQSQPAFEVATIPLQSSIKWIFMSFILVTTFGGTLIIFVKTRGINHGGEQALSLPSQIKSGSLIEGQVIAFEKDAYAKSHSSKRATNSRNFYKRYCIKFDERAGVNPPIYLNWEANAYHDGSMDYASGTLRRELIEAKKMNDRLFSIMEGAIESRQYLKFTLDEHLAVYPETDMH